MANKITFLFSLLKVYLVYAQHCVLRSITLLFLLIYTFVFISVPLQAKQLFEVDKPSERIHVVHNRSSVSVNTNLTTDNNFIELTDFTQTQAGLADIISLTPGVSLNGQGGLFQSYNIRGFSRARIKTEVNGVPIITDRRAGNSVAFIPSTLIQSVDIKKGPSSTLYGSGAIGGVISLSTLNFDDSTLSALVNPQDNTVQLHTHLTNGNLSTSVLHRQAQNATAPDNENTELFTQHEQQVASIAYQFDWNHINLLATTLYSKGDDFGKSSAEFQTSRNTIYPEDKHIISKVQFSKDEQWQLSLYHHYQKWHSDIDNLSVDENSGNLSISRTTLTRYQSDTFGSLATYAFNFDSNSAWYSHLFNNSIIGLEWVGRKNIKISEEEFNADNILVFKNDTIDADEDNVGLYINKSWQAKNVNINVGFRYDWQRTQQSLNTNNISPNSIEENFLSLSLNTQYQVSENTRLSFDIANAFRFPTVTELFFSGETPRGTTQGNNALLPEESIGGQLSFQHNFTSALTFNINSYYYEVDNYIERFTLENNDDFNVRSFRNIDEVIIKGFEISSNWQINTWLNSQFSYQKQQATDINNTTVDDTIPEAIKAQVFWTPSTTHFQGIEFDTQLEYRFKKTDIGNTEQTLPSDLIWNANLNIQVNDAHRLSFVLFNITNNTYRTSADEDSAFAKERNIAIKWQWLFN